MEQSIVLTASQKMALMTMESQAKQKTALDIFNEFTSMGLSQETITILKDISLKTAKDIAGKTIEIGKIIIMKIIDFIKENTKLAIGMVIGAAVASLVSFIPFIGPFLIPLGVAIGGIAGNRLQNGSNIDSSMVDNMENIIDIAVKFFNLLKEILLAIFKQNELM